MDRATHNKIISLLWGIADDVRRGLLKRGKYSDVILPMCVLPGFSAGASQAGCDRQAQNAGRRFG